MEKMEYFRKLSEVHSQFVATWYHLDKTPSVDNKDVKSVYCHSISKSESTPAFEDDNELT